MASCLGFVRTFTASLFRRRPFYRAEVLQTPLKRCLTLGHIVFYGSAIMAGAGIYVLTGTLVGKATGAAACLSYMLAGVAAIFTGLCYTEFATLIPRAGSVYLYTFLTIGELPAFVIGWTAVADSIVVISVVAKAFSGTINVLTNGTIVAWTLEHVGRLAPDSSTALAPTYDFIASALILVLAVIVATGAIASMSVNAAISALQITCLVVITVACFVYGSPESFSREHGGFAPHGFSGIVNGATIAVFAYSGFDAICNVAEEMLDPVRDIPRAMLIVVGGCIGFYCLASLGLAFLVPREFVDFSSPFVAGFERLGITWMVIVASVGTLLATGASKVSWMYSIPRCLYAIGKDGLIFSCFGWVDKRCQVPQFSLLFGSVISMIMAFFFKISELADFVSMGYLLSYFFVGVELIVMRYLMTKDARNDDDEDQSELMDKHDKHPLLSQIAFNHPMKLRETFSSFGEKVPSLCDRRFFIGMFAIHVAVAIILSALVAFAIPRHSLPSIIGTVVVAVVWSGTVFVLSIYQPSYNDKSYQTPLMPMAPVLTIFINAILILRLSTLTWIRFGIWSAIGLVMYFGYGRFHSVAREVKEEQFHLTDPDNFGAKVPSSSYGSESHKET